MTEKEKSWFGKFGGFDRSHLATQATVLLPVSLVFMVMLANDTELMGPRANKRSTNAIAITVIAFVGLCGGAYGIDSFLQATHLIGS